MNWALPRVPGLGRLRRSAGRLRDRLAGPGAVVLLYHRVAAVERDPQRLCVSPARFAEHVELIARRTTPISLAELSRAGDAGRVPSRAVAVTFDDGYADNYSAARPVLERFGVPATVFIATGLVGSRREFFWDELERLLLHDRPLPRDLCLDIGGTRHLWRLGEATPGPDHWAVDDAADPTPRHRAYRELCGLLRQLPPDDQRRTLDRLAAWAGAKGEGRPSHRAMTASEVAALATGGLVEVGAHTASHARLSSLPPDAEEQEIRRSKADLEEWTGGPVRWFSYPYGSPGDFTDSTVSVVRRAGFDAACANSPGAVRPRSDRFRLPRFVVRDWDTGTLARLLEGWYRA